MDRVRANLDKKIYATLFAKPKHVEVQPLSGILWAYQAYEDFETSTNFIKCKLSNAQFKNTN